MTKSLRELRKQCTVALHEMEDAIRLAERIRRRIANPAVDAYLEANARYEYTDSTGHQVTTATTYQGHVVLSEMPGMPRMETKMAISARGLSAARS